MRDTKAECQEKFDESKPIFFQLSYSKFRHSNHRIGAHACRNHTVPYGTALFWGGVPGTSCQATIAPSLRDKSHSPIERPRIKLALLGLKPRAETCRPLVGAISHLIPCKCPNCRGTSCLATIVLSLRDKSHSPIEAPDNYLSAYGAKPSAILFWPLSIRSAFGPRDPSPLR